MTLANSLELVIVFPAGAGMNRVRVAGLPTPECVPRRRGDEPFNKAMQGLEDSCSPQCGDGGII